MGEIIEIPFSRNLIEFIAERLIREKDYDLSRRAVVFPHKRPVLYLRRLIKEKLLHPFLPPQVFSMDGFMAYLASRVLPGQTEIDSFDSAYLLFKVVAQIPNNPWQGRDSFNQFLFWGLRLSKAIEELDMELVSSESLKGIEMGELWEPNVCQNAGILMNHLSEIRGLYHTLLEEEGLTTRGRNYLLAAENIERIGLDTLEEVYFAGLFALTKAEKGVIRHLLDQPGVCLVRQNDGTRWRPFEQMDGWAKVIEAEDQGLESPIPEISLYKTFNTHSEVIGLRDILVEKRWDDPEKTAIVLPQPESLIPLLSEVMTTLGVDYNISMGYPLVRTPIYALLDLFIKLQESSQNGAYYLPDYLSLLMHPYIKNIHHRIKSSHTRILIHCIEEMLLDQAKTFIGLTEIEENPKIFERAALLTQREVSIREFQETLHEIHELFIRKIEGVKTLFQLADSFEGILTYLLKHSPAVHYPFSGEFFSRFFSLLDKIKGLLIKDEELKGQDLFELFRHLAKEEHIPFEGEPLKGLQILGLLETRCLDFDRVLLLDANEGNLPGGTAFDSLFPLPIREALGIPLHYQEEEIFHYHFRHLIASSKEAHIFYRETEKDSRSRFVERLVWEKEKETGELGILKDTPIELNVVLRPSPLFEVAKTPQILEVLYKMNFSATGLNYYLGCPAKFYFAQILGLEEKEEIGELDATKIGEILHAVMERLYRPFVGGGVLGEKEYASLEGSLAGVLEDIFSKRFGQVRGEQYLLKEMASRRLREYILKEKERFINNISIVSLEEELISPFKIDEKTTIWLKGRADRVDQIGKEYIIIDYKSGRDLRRYSYGIFDKVFSSRDKMKEEIESLQLPFYVLLYQRIHSVGQDSINSKLVSLAKPKEEKSLFNEEIDRKRFLEEVFLPTLKNLILEILNPAIPFIADGEGQVCEYCPFPTFCRKRG
ncbi:TPA: hypothetical protein DCX15_04665 [bacterium]|nr:hypothetical protein [bacterium]